MKIVGTCTYVLAVVEILGQLAILAVSVNHIVMASGTSTARLALAGKALSVLYLRVRRRNTGASR